MTGPLTLLRWGRAEYEDHPLSGLPPEVTAIEHGAADPSSAPLEEADILVVPSRRRVDAAAVARLRRCRLVLTTTSGHDHLDLAALSRAGIPACRLPLARRDAVVHTALAMLLSLTRRLGRFTEAAQEGRWTRAELRQIGAILPARVAVIGAAGVIGSRMTEVIAALGAEVLPVDPALPGSLPLDRAVADADAITLHCELTPQTRGMFGADRIGRMRPGAVLVNTARGPLVDPDAAFDAVRSDHLSGLGLDVFPEEPWPIRRLVHPDVLLTPHAAGWHPGLGDACAAGVAEAVRALVEGGPLPWVIRPDGS